MQPLMCCFGQRSSACLQWKFLDQKLFLCHLARKSRSDVVGSLWLARFRLASSKIKTAWKSPKLLCQCPNLVVTMLPLVVSYDVCDLRRVLNPCRDNYISLSNPYVPCIPQTCPCWQVLLSAHGSWLQRVVHWDMIGLYDICRFSLHWYLWLGVVLVYTADGSKA